MRIMRRFRDIVRSSLLVFLFLLASPLLAAPTDADLTWGSDGELLAKHPPIQDQFLQMDGKLVTVNGTKIVRYRTTSAVDPTFGVSGVVDLETMIPLEYIDMRAGAAQSDGKILLAGSVRDGYEGLGMVTRLHPNGTLDATFGVNGIVTFDPNGIEGGETEHSHTIYIAKIAQQANGRIVISGTDSIRAILIRLMADGAFDASFDHNGVLYVSQKPGMINAHLEFHIQADGKLLTISFSFADPYVSLANEVLISRFNPDGTQDTGFNANNPILFNNTRPTLFAVETDYDGVHHNGAFIFALIENATDDEYQLRLVKYNGDGSVNPVFGEKVFPLPSTEDYYYMPSLRLVDDNKILFGASFGYEDNYLYLMQFNSDGTLDADFGKYGIFDTRTDYGWRSQLNGLEVQRDGKLILTSETIIGRNLGNAAFSYTGLTPAHRTTNAAVQSNLTVTFAEPVSINTGTIEIRRMADSSLFERIQVDDMARVSGHGTATITINPTNNFEPNTGYFVLVAPNTFTDTSNYPFSGVRELIEWHFTTGNLIVNTAPVLTGIGGKSIEAGQLLSFTTTGTDAENDTLSFTLDDGDTGSVPVGAEITAGGEFSWTPSEAQGGQHTFDVVVTDDGEPTLSDSETITVTVTASPVEPPTELLLNRGFENKTPNNPKRAAKWTANKLVVGDRRICNTSNPPKTYAYEGKCAFQFNYSLAKARYIEQKVALTDALEGQTMRVAGYVKRKGLTTGAALQVQITYVDNSKATLKIVIPSGKKGYKLFENTLLLEQNAIKVRVRITTGKSKGRLLLDDLSLTVSDETPLTVGDTPILVPDAPDLRGN